MPEMAARPLHLCLPLQKIPREARLLQEAHLRDVSELCVQTQSEVVEVGSRQFADLQRTMQSMFEEAGKLSKVNPLEVIVPATSTASRTRKAA